MRSELASLPNRVLRIPEVEVLLATFNGERHLPKFLESLLGQKSVQIHLRVSDDGSTDRTVQILERFSKHFTSFSIAIGPRKGAAANFFSLMQSSQFQFIALADQDDFWEENHLIDSVNRLNFDHNSIAMTFSKVIETFNPEDGKGKVWPQIADAPQFHQIFFENSARGCTIVMKRDLVNLICQKSKNDVVMHDWWILLVAKACGSVIFAPTVEVRYRLHSNNVVGRGPNLLLRIKSLFGTLISGRWAPSLQLGALQREFWHQMHLQEKCELDELFSYSELNLKDRVLKLLFSNKRYRINPWSDFLVKLYLIVEAPQMRSKL